MSKAERRKRYPPETLELYRRHRLGLLRLAEGIVGCRALAEDILHEAFVRFATRRGADEVASPLHYLFSTVRNISIDVYRRQQRQMEFLQSPRDASGTEDVPTEENDPEQSLSWKQDYQVFRNALAELPELVRRATHLHLVDQMSTRAIALKLNVSVGKAHQLVADGLAHCRARLLGTKK